MQALEDTDRARQKGAEEQQSREARLVEEANMLRRAVQVSAFCLQADNSSF